MTTKKVRLPITVGIVDERTSQPEIRDAHGRITQEARVFTKHVPAGEEVELDADEADRLLAKFGPYQEPLPPLELPPGGIPRIMARGHH